MKSIDITVVAIVEKPIEAVFTYVVPIKIMEQRLFGFIACFQKTSFAQ